MSCVTLLPLHRKLALEALHARWPLPAPSGSANQRTEHRLHPPPCAALALPRSTLTTRARACVQRRSSCDSWAASDGL